MRLNKLDLSQLQALQLLLADRSPSKVARRLNLTQPAVSAMLRKLRVFFDDPLLAQSGRDMVPTAFALSLAEPLREMLMRAESLAQMRPARDVSTYARTIRIALSDFVATVLLTPILRRAQSAAPLLRFELVSVFDSRHHYQEDLERGDVDVLIVPHTFVSDAHPQLFLLEEDYVCIACARRRLGRRGISVRQFEEAAHVGVTNRTVAGRSYDEMHLERLGVSRHVEVAVPSQLWIPQMIAGTDRLSLLHRHLAIDLGKRWPIQLVRSPVTIPPLREVMQWHAYQESDPALIWLKSELLLEAGKVAATSITDGPVRSTKRMRRL